MNHEQDTKTKKYDSKQKNGQGAMKRRRRRAKIAASTIGGFLILVIAFMFALPHFSTQSNPITGVVQLFQPLKPTNILLIGNNARNPQGPLDIGAGGGGQADIMMLAHIDPIEHKITLISIPRDMLFAMPQYNISIPKIKSLFFIGAQLTPNQAAQLTVQGVEKFTGMHIDYWVVTDFQGFSDAIDAVGGVRVDILGRIYDPAHSGANLYPGWQTLNGQQALAYIRVRQNTASSVSINDFERDNAQAQVLAALQQKLMDKSSDMAHIGSLVNTWYKDVVTNMNTEDLLKIANAVHGAKIKHINLANIGDSMDVMDANVQGVNQQNQITGAYYDIVDPAYVARVLKPYGSTGSWTGVPLPPPNQIPVDLYGSSIYAAELQKAGYQVTVLGSNGGVGQVQIDYPPGDLTWGLQVGRTLATGNSVVQEGSSSVAVVVYTP